MLDVGYMTSTEAAGRLGYTVQHLRRLIQCGKLRGVKIGRDWVVERSSVEEFAARGEYLSLPLPPPDLE